jgi:TP901 family phage tail tape measure protein
MAKRISIDSFIDLAGIKQGINELNTLLKSLTTESSTYQATLAGGLSEISKAQNDLKNQVKQSQTIFQSLNAEYAAHRKQAAELSNEIQRNVADFSKLSNAQKRMTDESKSAQNSVDGLKKQIKDLTTEYNRLDQSTDENKKSAGLLADKIKELKSETKTYADALKVSNKIVDGATDSYNKLRQEQTRLTAELRKLSPKDSGFATLKTQIQDNQKRLDDFNRAINSSRNVVADYGAPFKAIGAQVLLAFSVTSVISFGKALVDLQYKISDLQANVRKTAGFTAKEVEKFTNQLQNIDTRTSLEGLLEIGKVGGQLGIAKDQLLGFTEAVDKAVVALGDEFSGGAEEVTKVIGGLRNIFGDIKTANIGNDILNIGNALNALGASGAATGPVVADFASRIGGVGITLGLTSGQVLGLSATLQELNVTAERGGSAVVRILQKMASEPAKFAEVAGIGVEEFTNLVNTDLFGAFNKVTEGANKSGGSATALASILKELDVDGVGAAEVFAKLGSNAELLAKRTDLATKSLKETSSITDEFAVKNQNFASVVDKSYKNLNSFLLAISNSLALIFGGTIELIGQAAYAIGQLINPTRDLSDEFKKQTSTLNDLEKSVTPLLARYDELSKKEQLTAEEQQELIDITKKVASQIPIAASKFDDYGNAMDISTKSAREYIKSQKEILNTKSDGAIRESLDELQKVNKEYNKLQDLFKGGEAQNIDGKWIQVINGEFKELSYNMQTNQREVNALSNNALVSLQNRFKELSTQKLGIEEKLTELKVSTAGFMAFLEDFSKIDIIRKNKGDADSFVKADAEERKKALEELAAFEKSKTTLGAKATEEQQKAYEKALKDQQEYNKKLLEDSEELAVKRLEREVEVAKRQVEIVGISTQEKFQAQVEALRLEEKLAELEGQIAKRRAENPNQVALAEEEAANKIIDIRNKLNQVFANRQASNLGDMASADFNDKFQSESDKRIASVEEELQRRKVLNQIAGADEREIQRQKYEKLLEDYEEFQSKYGELAQAGADLVIGLINQNYENRIEKLESEKTAVDEKLAEELELYEGNEQAQAFAKANAEAEKKKIDEQIKKEKLRQFRFNKAIRVSETIADTAKAIIGALAQTPLPAGAGFAIATGALGAIQLATILAQQPPKFAKGIKRVEGRGTETSDSIVAMLSKNERVVDAPTNRAIGYDFDNRLLPEAVDFYKRYHNDFDLLATTKKEIRLLQAPPKQISSQTKEYIYNQGYEKGANDTMLLIANYEKKNLDETRNSNHLLHKIVRKLDNTDRYKMK